jgi:hypothetical protein
VAAALTRAHRSSSIRMLRAFVFGWFAMPPNLLTA